ncbi:MAG: DUF3784 domain-containing protein [Clostridia bacterium]|nr:DUF3784 domain-containing protein [Clostridia bacterium]
MIALIGVGILTLIMGILVKHFKCYWLISGYNTAPAEYRKNIDIVGLSRLVGNLCFALAGVLMVSGILSYANYNAASMAVLALMFVITPYSIVKSQKYDLNVKKRFTSRKGFVTAMVIFLVLIPIVVGTLVFQGAKEPSIDINKEYIEISGIYAERILMKDIRDIEIKDTIPKVIIKTNGYNFGNVLKGNFKLKDMGTGKLHIQSNKSPYIYIYKNEGYSIINLSGSTKTQEVYQDLMVNWGK